MSNMKGHKLTYDKSILKGFHFLLHYDLNSFSYIMYLLRYIGLLSV